MTINQYFAAVAIPVLVVFSIAISVSAQEESAAMLKAALVANHSNIDAFPRYRCHYTLTKANADNETTALRGEYQGVRSCDFVVVVDGAKQKFQSFGPSTLPPPQNAVKENDGRMSVSVEFLATADLQLGEHFLRYFPPFENARVKTSNSPTRNDLTPFSMVCIAQRLSPKAAFLDGEGINAAVSGRGQIAVDGHVVVHVHGTAKSIDNEYFFDVSQGYLPLKVIRRVEPPYAAGKYLYTTHLLKAKDCGRGRWFPMTWLQVFVDPAQKQVAIQELRVTELDVDNKPTDEDFSIVMAAGTSIESEPNSAREAPRSFRLRQPEKVTPDDIPRLAKMLEEVGNSPLMDTAIPRPGLFARAKWALIGGGVAILIAAALTYFRRGMAPSKRLAQP